MRLLKSKELNAVLGEEFIALLDKLGVKAEFEAGKYNCQICGEQVGSDNVLLLLPLSDNELGFVCRKPDCIIKYKLAAES